MMLMMMMIMIQMIQMMMMRIDFANDDDGDDGDDDDSTDIISPSLYVTFLAVVSGHSLACSLGLVYGKSGSGKTTLMQVGHCCCQQHYSTIPLFQYSIIPLFHYSIIPFFH